MKFEEILPKGSGREVFKRWADDGRQVITIAHTEPCSDGLKYKTKLKYHLL